MNIIDLTPGQLRRAAAIKQQIARLQNDLNRLLGGQAQRASRPRKRRKMSAAARARIAAAARQRWAKWRSGKK
jgi:hypothetical protein